MPKMFKGVIQALTDVQSKRINKAAELVKAALIDKELTVFKEHTGHLQKGTIISYDGQDKNNLDHAKVGFSRPAQHAHLLEFGTAVRTVRNWYGHKGLSHQSGAMKATHFTAKTFEEQAGPVKEILEKEWV